jgi:REase_DpnII-MboI
MNEEDIFASRITKLRNIVEQSFITANEQSQGFALRILGAEPLFKGKKSLQFDLAGASLSAHYGGVPTAAYLGYGISHLSTTNLSGETYDKCWETIKRIHSRSGSALDEFIRDDVAVLGVVDGISTLNALGISDEAFRSWLVQLIEQENIVDSWSGRLRALSAELLEERGRLQTRLNQADPFTLSLDLCLQNCWPQVYKQSATLDQSIQQQLMKSLLIEPPPEVGDLERSVIWLQSLNLLAQQTVASLLPSVSDTARILKNTQAALKRWVWDEKSKRKNVSPAHWLIDDEYHVQSFLWAILYPIFKEQLVDEMILPGYGLLQPRADFGIVNLKLIVEVKILRTKADFTHFEEQIAGDLGIYFSEPNRFDRMIVYFYDDCETQHPELYDILRGALQRRDTRIEDVVFVRRPSMIPSRSSRNI